MQATFVHFLFSSNLSWVSFAVYLAVALIAGYLYRFARIPTERQKILFVRLIVGVVCFRVAFAALRTGLQYYAWSQDAMGKLLLPPTQSIAVFLRYSWTHFWINVFISVAVGLFMLVLLNALKKKNERFFEEGEVELGALMAFVAGWPQFVVFFPLVAVFVVLFSIVRGIVFKEPFTTLGWPLIAAAVVSLLSAMWLISLLHLTALII